MNIIVCIKQVPATTKVLMDSETNTIIRNGIDSILNPFDTFALEAAIHIKETVGADITAITMGIHSAKKVLRQSISYGIDNAVLMTDRSFAGSDTLATAYILSKGIKTLPPFNLIICGKQATDGDTAQVGPSLANMLNIPHVTDVCDIEFVSSEKLICKRITDDGHERLEITLPALITVSKDLNVPRLPSIAGLRRGFAANIKELCINDIDADTQHLGLSGSPTQVVSTFVPTSDIVSEWIYGKSKEQAMFLSEKLLEKGIINKKE